MAYRNNNQYEKLQQLTDQLEKGVRQVFESERYAEYLKVMSKFHRYSYRNCLLIAMQNPNATMVASYGKWQELGRQVQRGEKAIQILAPSPYKTKQEREVLDQETRKPLLNEDGTVMTEEVEITVPAFRAANVFDLAQTQGEPLPTLFDNLEGDVNGFRFFMKAMEWVSPVPIAYEAMTDKDGYYDQVNKRIMLRDDMSERQTVAAVIHETAHAKLHDLDPNRLKESLEARGKDQETIEVEAESIAYVVSQYFGIETAENSYGYIAMWSRGKELPELHASLDVIRKTSAELIDGLEAGITELRREQEAFTSVENTYGIYQIREDFPLYREYSFRSLSSLERNGLRPIRENYQLVYDGRLEEGETLDSLYERFNVNHPDGYHGHSLSVSDVVVLHESGVTTAHYVDSVGFPELPGFLELDSELPEPELEEQKEAYKPLAKVEELEEANYNMIDNVLNNMPSKKEHITLEFYAAVCDEFHDMGAFYTGYDLQEIAQKYQEIINDPTNSYMGNGMGIIWHDSKNDFYEGMELALIHGTHIQGDNIDLVSFMAAEPMVHAVIEQIREIFPDFEYTPAKALRDSLYPEKMTTEQLAEALRELAEDFDTYGYRDDVIDEQTELEDMIMSLRAGRGYEVLPFLKDVIEEGRECGMRAEVLAEKVREYVPDIPENMEPMVKVSFCEENVLAANVYWKLSVLDQEVAFLDQKLSAEVNSETGEPEKMLMLAFTVYYPGEEKVESFNERINIGNGDGGLISSMKAANEMVLADEDWIRYQQNKGEESYQSFVSHLTDMQEKILPYLQSFCSVTERAPEQETDQRDEQKATKAVTSQASIVESKGKTKGALKQGTLVKHKKSLHERIQDNKAVIAKKQGNECKERGVDLA